MRINGVQARESRARVVTKIRRARMMSPNGKPVIIGPVFPNAGVEAWYANQLDALIGEMYISARAVAIGFVSDMPPVVDSALTPTAAGIMFRTPEGKILLLKRNEPGFDFWGLPGGGIEPGETAEEAARREVYEECEYTHLAPLELLTMHRYKTTLFATFGTDVLAEFAPKLNHEHTAYTWVEPSHALMMNLHPGVRTALTHARGMVFDEAPKQLQRLLEKWGRQWIKRFDLMAQKISNDFAAKNQHATQTSMMSQFAKAGFTVKFKPTRASIAAYQAVAAEQIGLIKSIPQKFLQDVQANVWDSVRQGSDLRTLSAKLQKSYGVTKRRAALIARDQNAKAKAVLEAVRHQELGIKQAIWMHSRAGKEPRRTHVAMNNKLYDLDRGMWDSDEQAYVQPGELINCRCTMRPYIPGFESAAFPEWEIAQT